MDGAKRHEKRIGSSIPQPRRAFLCGSYCGENPRTLLLLTDEELCTFSHHLSPDLFTEQSSEENYKVS